MSENNHKLSKRLLSLSESATLEMTRKSREMREQGIDIITLSIGEPDFNTPENVKQAGIKAIENNLTHYPPVAGTNELRKAIADKLLRDNGLHYKPSQIIVSNGAKQSIMNAFFSILDAGDEVLIPAPFWVSYPEMVKMVGATPITIPSKVEQDFKITASQLEKAITPRTKAFIFSSPCNPSGSVYEKEELAAFAKVFEQHPNIFVFSDEIYEYIRFEGKHHSIASFEKIKDQVIVINGLSKGFAMTGWRVGYLAAHQDVITACITIQGQYTSGSCTISQAAALEAVSTIPSESEELKNMLFQFNKRRDLLYNRLKSMKGIIPNKPKGAFYMFPDISFYFGKTADGFTINNSTDLSMYLLEHAHVALVSGDAFGCDKCIRFSYATTEAMLEESCNRIEKALSRLK